MTSGIKDASDGEQISNDFNGNFGAVDHGAPIIDVAEELIKRSVMHRLTDTCASCSEPVTHGAHDRGLRANEVRPCPICGDDLVRSCERVNGSRVVRCAGGHVLEASVLAWF